MRAEELVRKHAEEKGIKISEDAVRLMASTLDSLCQDILEGAEKIREYSGKEEVDEEAVKIAAYLDVRLKKLF